LLCIRSGQEIAALHPDGLENRPESDDLKSAQVKSTNGRVAFSVSAQQDSRKLAKIVENV
jgi:hypothetical protein